MQPPEHPDWSKQEKLQLVEGLLALCPEHDKMSYHARGRKIDWTSVHVGDHTGPECQEMWNSMLAKVRKFRTLREVLEDAKDVVENPLKGRGQKRHPDQPVRPLTPFFRYIMDHRETVKAENPSLKSSEITKTLSERWNALSEAKQAKYHKRYRKEWEKFIAAQAEFLGQHPELVKPAKPVKPSPMQQYVSAKLPSYQEKHPDMTVAQAKMKLRRKYGKLSADKKKKWVKKALEAVPEYEEQVREYQQQHPDFMPAPLRLGNSIDRVDGAAAKYPQFEGAPAKPPKSAFMLYVKKKLPEMEGHTGNKLVELARQWKTLSPEKQKKYHKKLEKWKAKYEEELETFKQSLSPEDLANFEESLKPRKKQKARANGEKKKRKMENAHAEDSPSKKQRVENEHNSSS